MSQQDRLIALAAMFQAGYLIRQIARTGMADTQMFETNISSILKTDAASTEDVYGGIQGVKQGMSILATLFERDQKERDLEIARYVLGIVHLEKKLSKNSELMNKLVAGIERCQHQSETFGVVHENVISNLASVYAETISTLQPRIVVAGEEGHLTNPRNAEKVRALLLSLMRAAVLWKQKGGRRWHLIFTRGSLIKQAKALANQM